MSAIVQHAEIDRAPSVLLCSVQHFAIPELRGISREQLEVHLKLYEGYVNALNGLRKHEADLVLDAGKNALQIDGIRRRLAFEFSGMRMHELYFAQWEHGAQVITPDSLLGAALATQFGSYQAWEAAFQVVGTTRGIGWTVLYYDIEHEQFINAWVEEHHLGQLSGLPIILVMDLWEHAYMIDYEPADKLEHVDAFFHNLNWRVAEERFVRLSAMKGLSLVR